MAATVICNTTQANQPPVWNWPNVLTALRFVLSVPIFVCILLEQFWWATGLFALAAITDWLDGFLARRLRSGTALGRNLDPLADKVLVCGSLILLIPINHSGVLAWMVAVIVLRELIVTSLRSFLEHKGLPFGAALLGKLKLVLQALALLAVFVYLALVPEERSIYPLYNSLYLARDALLYATVTITAISGLEYLWRAYQAFRGRV